MLVLLDTFVETDTFLIFLGSVCTQKLYSSKGTYINIYSSTSNSLNSYLSKSKKVSDKKKTTYWNL